MDRFFLFLNKIYVFVLFIIIEAVCFNILSSSSNYSRAKMVNFAMSITGSVYDKASNVKNYFSLRKDNEILLDKIDELNNQLAFYKSIDTVRNIGQIPYSDSLSLPRLYDYKHARVTRNSINRLQNYITLNKGYSSGMFADMAVVGDKGIVGYIKDCSENYSSVVSVLNTDFRTSGKIKGTDFFGAIYWEGMSYDKVKLSELPKHSGVKVGDTIVTTNSNFFPDGIMIGTVENIELVNGTHYYADVKLAQDMTSLNNVIVIQFADYNERAELEARTELVN